MGTGLVKQAIPFGRAVMLEKHYDWDFESVMSPYRLLNPRLRVRVGRINENPRVMKDFPNPVEIVGCELLLSELTWIMPSPKEIHYPFRG